MHFMAEFHRNGKLLKGLNSTFIALIPKDGSPQRSVISESQTAFVKDRQILDGILIANEVMDEARKIKKELMLIKVDFEKAYDSFADDTLLLGTKSWANVRALRTVLVLFEMMSGLKVNFNKSMLVGVNIDDSWFRAAATALHCKVGK
ncbi:cysteine-rich receptor-like protein kinase, partial [Trifolium medium]|nr:cysteine-rich receptor-like protein kinase [Trifolium medium]